MISHTVCPLCKSDRIPLYIRCTDHLISQEEFDLCKCHECGFIFTREYPDESSMARYYESTEYIPHDDKAKGFVNRIYILARDIMLRKKETIIEDSTGLKKGSILDIGCGTGHFATAMKKGGWDVTGVESNVKARNFVSDKLGLTVLEPEMISSLPDRSFDCVTMWHVLEHVHDPEKYAAEISRLLKPGGIFIAALPNSNSFDAVYYGKFWAAYDSPRHLWHFSPDSFGIFAKKTGFNIKGIRTLPLDVFYISILSEKYKGTRFYFLTGLIKGSLFALRTLFIRYKSSSLIYFLNRIKDLQNNLR